MAGCWIFCLLFCFIHLFALSIGYTPYGLLPVVTTELSFHLTMSTLPSLLKSKDPLSIVYIFWHQQEDNSLSCHSSLCQLLWIPWLRGHISMNSLKRSCQSKRCDLLDFYRFPKYFWQHVYTKVHHYFELSFLNFFVQKIIQWLNFRHAWLTQRLVVSIMEKRFDFKQSVSANCFTKYIT